MLVDINLLPKKEARDMTNFVIVLLMILLLIIGGGVVYIFYEHALNEKAAVTNKLQTTRSLIEMNEEKLDKYKSLTGVEQLEEVVKWIEEFPIKSVPILNELSSLLPERGFFRDFTYSDEGTIQVIVQFDNNREVAYYLTELLHSNYFSEVNLISVQTEEIDTSVNDDVLPRYVAKYQLTLNKSYLDKHSEDG